MPIGECFRGAESCPRCARAEAVGQPVIDRSGTMHIPEKMRNPCHGRRSNPDLLLLGNPPVMLLRKEDRRNLPPLYSQEHNPDPTVWVKFFTPWASWTWYCTEFDGTDRFFGLVDGHEMELGYFSLAELQQLRGPGGLRVERDMHWRPTPLSKVKSRQVNPTMTRAEALAEARRRWGPDAMTRISGVTGIREICVRDDIGGRSCPDVRGSGPSWEAAFADADRRRSKPSAPRRIRYAWEKFHFTDFGKAKSVEIDSIPGVPENLWALGQWQDCVLEDGTRWGREGKPGYPSPWLCHNPVDQSLWIVATEPLPRVEDGAVVKTVAYRTHTESHKDHVVYEHRFHRPRPTVRLVEARGYPLAALLDGGKYAVTDWIRK